MPTKQPSQHPKYVHSQQSNGKLSQSLQTRSSRLTQSPVRPPRPPKKRSIEATSFILESSLNLTPPSSPDSRHRTQSIGTGYNPRISPRTRERILDKSRLSTGCKENRNSGVGEPPRVDRSTKPINPNFKIMSLEDSRLSLGLEAMLDGLSTPYDPRKLKKQPLAQQSNNNYIKESCPDPIQESIEQTHIEDQVIDRVTEGTSTDATTERDKSADTPQKREHRTTTLSEKFRRSRKTVLHLPALGLEKLRGNTTHKPKPTQIQQTRLKRAYSDSDKDRVVRRGPITWLKKKIKKE